MTEEKKIEETTGDTAENLQEVVSDKDAQIADQAIEAVKPQGEDDLTKLKKELKPGVTARIYQKIKELNSKGEEKERLQYFEGIVISRKHGNELGATVTVRKISDGVGVEKIFPVHLPSITKIVIKKKALVRRAKLNYLRSGFKRKLKEAKKT